MTIILQMQHRRDTLANWNAVNPTLASGEWGYVTDTNRYKVGDGATAWVSLPYTPIYPDNHATLRNRAYADALHTGFAPPANPIFTGIVSTPTLAVTSGVVTGALIVSDAGGNFGFLSGSAGITILMGDTAAIPIWTDATGTGTPVKSAAPTFTGTPSAPTAAVGTNTTQIATTEFRLAQIPNRNAIINGSFYVSQRGTVFTSTTVPANNDDTYLLDRWILLSDGNDIVDVSQETSLLITDPLYNIKLDVETANKKFGVLTILDNISSRRFINQTVSLSFKSKVTGTTIGAIRAGVLSWSSTADVVTSDVVDTWEAAGTNPVPVANWTFENVPAALTVPTTAWATYTIPGILIDTASATNVAVFIWTDDTTMDVGDFLQIAEVQLEVNPSSTPFEVLPYGIDLDLCQRYCYGVTTTVAAENIGFGVAASTTIAYPRIVLPVEMRVVPTITATAADWQLDNTADAPTDVTELAIDDLTFSNTKMVTLKSTVADGLVASKLYYLVGDGTTGRQLLLTAEL